MEKIIREFALLRYVRNCNRKGEFPKFLIQGQIFLYDYT